SDSGNCLGRGCADYARCFYFKARKQMFGANVLVVNHALFFSDLALRREGANLLPDYKAVIFDEAHTLEDVAADHLGIQVSRGAPESVLTKPYSRQRRGLFAFFGSEDSIRQVEATRQAGERFFNAVLTWAANQPRNAWRTANPQSATRNSQSSDSVRVREPNVVPDGLSEELLKLASRVDEVAERLDEEQQIEFTAVADRV